MNQRFTIHESVVYGLCFGGVLFGGLVDGFFRVATYYDALPGFRVIGKL